MLLATFATTLLLAGAPARESLFDSEIQAACDDVRRVFAVPPELVKAVIKRESDFNARAFSKAGAVGLMQVMPYNAEHLGIERSQLWEPRYNILAGTRLLSALLKHYNGDLLSALSGYNARPRALYAIPNNGETPAYVVAVLHNFERYKALARVARR
jgi:soluble lytic murein transglycosylase-like protein